MVHTISVIGTEAYYEEMSNPDDHMQEMTYEKLLDWWEEEIEDGSGATKLASPGSLLKFRKTNSARKACPIEGLTLVNS